MRRSTRNPNQDQDAARIRRRLAVAGALCLAAVTGLMAQMARLQVINHDHYATLSQENRLEVNAIPPSRGRIYDRDGRVLAENRPSYLLLATPERIPDLEATLDRVSGLIELTEAQRERFRERVEAGRPFEAITLRSRLDEQEVAKLAVHRHRLPGLEVDAHLVRHYPQGKTASHPLGYVGRMTAEDLRGVERSAYRGTRYIGKSGIEKAYEETLHGEVGMARVETNAAGRAVRALERRPPRSGEDLTLTLDLGLQEVAERALGDRRGAVIALRPDDGAILAMASRPRYDPNTFVEGMSRARFRELEAEGWQPLINRAIRGTYPPASTIKPFVGLAALEHEVIEPDSEVYCDGEHHIDEREEPFHCWREGGHGHTDYTEAIAQSCNVFFYDTTERLGIDRMSAFLEPFGFGSATGIGLDGERSGILPSRAWKRRNRGGSWYPGETLINGIGLGYFSTTPLQLARATATLANRGRVIEPSLVRDGDAGGRATPTAAGGEADGARVELDDPSNWEATIQAMRAAVEHPQGTARLIGQGLAYRLAGKTGTAQLAEIQHQAEAQGQKERLRSHALFLGFAPVADPEIVVVVVVEHADGGGGAVAAPVARAVTDAWLLDDRSFLEQLEAGRIDDSEVEDVEQGPRGVTP